MLCYTINRIRFYNRGSNNQQITNQEEEIKSQEVDISTWDTEKVEIYTDEAGEIVPIPKGYVVSGKDDEHTVNTGLVIYEGDVPVTNENAWEESKTRNQWVWVPVPDPSRIYEVDENGKKKSKLYDYTSTGRTLRTNNNCEPAELTKEGYDSEKYLLRNGLHGMSRDMMREELQVEFEETMASIEKYGGYYIGRYETGNITGDYTRPVVVKMNEEMNDITWYKAYSILRYLAKNESIKSNIIWGNLWDETLQWLVDSGDKTYEELYNSKDWGNHSDSEFDYITTSGEIIHKNIDNKIRIPTGSSEKNKANNIYDLAGNVFEWTLEGRKGENSRMYRSGNYSDYVLWYSASKRSYGHPDLKNSGDRGKIGVRAYMYIK